MTVAALPIPNFVLFPGCTVTLAVGLPALQKQVEYAQKRGGLICLALADENWEPAGMGCLAEIRKVVRTAQGWAVTLAGIRRLKLHSQLHSSGLVFWHGEALASEVWPNQEPPRLSGLAQQVVECQDRFPQETWLDIAAFHSPGLSVESKQRLLAELDPRRRYYHLLEETKARPTVSRLSMN